MTKIQFNRLPFRLIVGIYFLLTFAFAGAYCLPSVSNNGISFLDAWFLSASAISVTGLSTVNITEDLSTVGQVLLLLEIQIGGIGIMAILGIFLMVVVQNMSVSQQTLLSFDQNQRGLKSIKTLMVFILSFTFIAELIGFFAVYPIIAQTTNRADAIFLSAFHAVASFTNAGFDLFGGSLDAYRTHPFFLLTTAALILAGAIGFPTVLEILFSKGKKKSLYTKVNVTGHMILILIGFVGFFLLERVQAFNGLNGVDRLTNALFLSVTSRNGGLSSIDISTLTSSSLFLLMLLMFIGGSASSAAGGIRVTTAAVLGAKLRSILKGQEEVVLFKKSLYTEDVNKSLLIFFVFAGVFFMSAFTLSMVETSVPLQALVFEIMSAMTTTGLSIGITADLSAFSLIWLSLLMILGRIGIIALIYSLIKPTKTNTRYVKEHLIVG